MMAKSFRKEGSARSGARSAGSPTPRRTVNFRLLLGIVVAVVVLAPAGYWWYSYQRATSVAEAILESAENRAEAGDWRGAVSGFHQYLQLYANDAHASIRLAEAYGRLAREAGGYETWTRAIDLHRKALANAAEDEKFRDKQDELGLELAALQLELGQQLSVSGRQSGRPEHLLHLQGAEAAARDLSADDGDGWALFGLALYGQYAAKVPPEEIGSLTPEEIQQLKDGSVGKEYHDANLTVVEILERANVRDASRPELALQAAVTLAQIYRSDEGYSRLGPGEPVRTGEERGQLADKVMDELVARSSQDAKVRALLARYRYRQQYQTEVVEGRADLDAALAQLDANSEDWQLMLNAARSAFMGAQAATPADAYRLREIAKQFYDRVAEIRAKQKLPPVPAAYWGLARVHDAEGNYGRAAEICRAGLSLVGGDSIEGCTLLTQSLLLLGKTEEAEKAWELLRQAHARESAQTSRTQREMILLDCDNRLLKAAILTQEGKHQDAVDLIRGAPAGGTAGQPAQGSGDRGIIPTLTSLHDDSSQVRERLFRAWTQVAPLYARSSQWERAAEAYEEAAAATGGAHLRSRVLAVLARVEAGQLDEAAEQSPEVWLLAASDLYQRQRSLAPETRDWSTFVNVLGNRVSKQGLWDPWRVDFLKAAYLYDSIIASGNRREAVRQAAEVLSEAEKEHEKLASGDEEEVGSFRRFLYRLVLRYEELGVLKEGRREADRVYDRFAQLEQEDPTVAPLLRADLLVNRRQYDDAREVLTTALAQASQEDQARLKIGLFRISLRVGDLEKAQRELTDLAPSLADDPRYPALVMNLFDVALVLNDLAAAKRCESALEGVLEGEDRDLLYCQARTVLAEAELQNARVVPAEAAVSRAEISAEWPNWWGLHVLDGLIREQQGDLAGALERYEEAIRQGATALSVFERLVPLAAMLRGRGEAAQYEALVQASLRSDATQLAEGYSDRLIDLSRRATERDPGDLAAWVRLSSATMLVSGEPKKGQEARKRALELLGKTAELSAQDVPACFRLVGLCVAGGETDDAKTVVDRIDKDGQLPLVDKATLLARCYQLLKDDARAEAKFREATQLAPKDAATWERLGDQLLSNNSGGAEEAYRRGFGLATDSDRLRLKLARVLAAQGEWDEAERLLMQSAGGERQPEPDPRLEAVRLAVLGGRKNLEAATQMLAQAVAQGGSASPADQRVLAQLYDVLGDADAAAKCYLDLANRDGPEPTDIASYVLFLIRRNSLDSNEAHLVEAEKWLAKLEELSPGTLGTTVLKARFYAAQGREEELKELVKQFAVSLIDKAGEDEQAKAGAYLTVGNVYSAVDRHEEAGDWYRRFYEIAPEGYRRLAESFAQQGRIGDAIDLCLKAAESDPSPRPANALAVVLLAGRPKPTPEELQRAEPVFTKALETHGNDAGLLVNVANVRAILQNQVNESVALLRRVIEAQPTNSAALNNLATYLGEQPDQQEEALEYVDRAIRLHGPSPGLLDTKAMILFSQGRLDEARQLLEKAVLRRDPRARSDPRYPFHLAAVQLALGDTRSAGEALNRARAGGLADEILTQADRQLLAQLDQKLAN